MEKILQFGEGNFLRAFAQHFIQIANDNGEDIGVAITQPRTNTEVINALKKQNCRYSIYLKGRKDGEIIDKTVEISCVKRCIDSVTEYGELEELFKSDDLEIIISNTTEAGICFDGSNESTFPAKITKLLFERFKAKSKPLAFLPVELIENNGTQLKSCILKYAVLWQLGEEFSEYVNSCSFCNTLVDRIVTGHIDGDVDPCSVACEPYASWIIEADEGAKKALTFTKYSSDIIFSNDLEKYRERKVKILNGTHTMSVLAAYLCGFTIVRDMMNDTLFSRYIDMGLEEIKETIAMPKDELDEFADAVKERFNNPFIDHKLLDISLNSVSKFKARCLPSIIDYYKTNNRLPKILTFSLAALIAFYKQSGTVRDSEEVKALFENDVTTILQSDIWGAELSFLEEKVSYYYRSILENGMKSALKNTVHSVLYKISDEDNVAILLKPMGKGMALDEVFTLDDIPFGHKISLNDIKKGEKIIKYANPIGHAVCDIPKGSHIHDHNIKTNLTDNYSYSFDGCNEYSPTKSDLFFDGYLRDDGTAATRNEIWIIPTVGCVNNTVRTLQCEAEKMSFTECDGVFSFTHPYGCSQMGSDREYTEKILSSLINHPNAGGVLVVSLGCENTNITELKKHLGKINENRVKFLVTQDCADELEEGKKLLAKLYSYVKSFKRQKINADKLIIGMKCGGSDAFSGITANSLCGRITDKLTDLGASVILTETPEMFGAEHLLMKRAQNKDVFDKTVSMIEKFKAYYSSHGQVCYENPSPGNHDGGITTLEEKSLGCIQKGGKAVITDVLDYGERVKKPGLNLLTGPGNDIVSTTNLTCAGANIILFTTGRGTPLGAPVPTVKIASNSALAERKSNWIDFDAQSGPNEDELLSLIIDVASGKQAKNEINNCREIAIFKDGVML